MIWLGVIGVLGVYIDILIWSATTAFWREFVHKVALVEKADAAWTVDIAWTLIDGAFAVLVVGGTGLGLAAVLVSSAAAAWARR